MICRFFRAGKTGLDTGAADHHGEFQHPLLLVREDCVFADSNHVGLLMRRMHSDQPEGGRAI